MRTKLLGDMSISEDAAIAIDQTTLQSVYTWTQPGMAPDRCTADRAHPTVRTLGSYSAILHPALKTVRILRRDGTGTMKCLRVATRESLWEGGLTSTSPPLIPCYPTSRYGSALYELNSALTPRSAGWCVRKGPVKRSVHSVSDRGELMSSKRK
jgi:hypothetical protein